MKGFPVGSENVHSSPRFSTERSRYKSGPTPPPFVCPSIPAPEKKERRTQNAERSRCGAAFPLNAGHVRRGWASVSRIFCSFVFVFSVRLSFSGSPFFATRVRRERPRRVDRARSRDTAATQLRCRSANRRVGRGSATNRATSFRDLLSSRNVPTPSGSGQAGRRRAGPRRKSVLLVTTLSRHTLVRWRDVTRSALGVPGGTRGPEEPPPTEVGGSGRPRRRASRARDAVAAARGPRFGKKGLRLRMFQREKTSKRTGAFSPRRTSPRVAPP